MSGSDSLTAQVHGMTDVGKVRESNEDAFCIADLTTRSKRETSGSLEILPGRNGGLLAVADGMGGAEAGQLASRLAVRTLYNHMQIAVEAHSELDDETVKAVVLDALDVANRRIYGVGISTRGMDGMGTTLTLAYQIGKRVLIGHVGDSRAYLIRAEGIGQLTSDQSLVASKVASGELTEIEARFHPERNILLQALGTQPDVEPDLRWVTIHPADILLLCSDGLHDQMETDEIYSVVVDAPSLPAACSTLVDLANRRGGPDNITVVAARFDPDAGP